MSELILCYWCDKPFGTWFMEKDKNGKDQKMWVNSPCRSCVNNKGVKVYMHESCYPHYLNSIKEKHS